ncbi:hypothetical protein [Methylomonas sp. MgM2]
MPIEQADYGRWQCYTPAMRLFKLILVIVLAFAIPLQGIAAVFTIEQKPCPLKSAELKNEQANREHTCCNDERTSMQTGKPCKAEKECQPTGLAIISFTQNQLPSLHHNERFIVTSALTPTFFSSDTWRPPNRR